MKYTKTFKNVSGYTQDDFPIEIDANYGGKPLHILLGNDNICYEAARKNVYDIKNG